jgi:hypothetical protein
MPRLRSWMLIVAAASLGVAGFAMAGRAPKSSQTVSADVTATSASNVKTKTCPGDDGTYELVRGKYSGTTSGATDPALAGSIEIRVDSWFNLSENLGVLQGKLKIDTAGPGKTEGELAAVNNNGSIVGWITTHSPKGTRIMGTLSGAWTKTGGFTGPVHIGSSSATNLAILASGGCKKPKP